MTDGYAEALERSLEDANACVVEQHAHIKELEKRLDDIETIAVNDRTGCVTCANVVLRALAGKPSK